MTPDEAARERAHEVKMETLAEIFALKFCKCGNYAGAHPFPGCPEETSEFLVRASVNCYRCAAEIVLRGLCTYGDVRDAIDAHIDVCKGWNV
jgi:hypothetical protein